MARRAPTKSSRPRTARKPARAPSHPTSDIPHPRSFTLGENSYGKSRVRLLKVSRVGKRHSIRELTADIALRGDFEAIHTRGDNRLCLPTDTMKNTVYALAKDHPIDTIEEFAAHLAEHFLHENRQLSDATVRISEIPWKRVKLDGGKGAEPHPHTFLNCSAERRTCEITAEDSGVQTTSGITDLVLLKSTDSAFSGYPKTRFTTLPETRDRIFCTSITASWPYRSAGSPDFAAARDSIREALIDTFATHKSESVQQTLYAMAESALRACDAIDSITLSLPNRHYLLANLAPFGIDNPNEIFVPTDEPHGLIEATVERR